MLVANAIKTLRPLGEITFNRRYDLDQYLFLTVTPRWGFNRVLTAERAVSNPHHVNLWRVNGSWRASLRAAVRSIYAANAACDVMGRHLGLYSSANYDAMSRLYHQMTVSLDGGNHVWQYRCTHRPTLRGDSCCHPDFVTMVRGAIAQKDAHQLVDFLQDNDESFRRAWESGFAR